MTARATLAARASTMTMGSSFQGISKPRVTTPQARAVPPRVPIVPATRPIKAYSTAKAEGYEFVPVSYLLTQPGDVE